MQTWRGWAVVVVLMSATSTADGQDLRLKVEITTSQTAVHNNQDFIVDTVIRNISKEEQVLQTNMCYYGDWNWQTDNRAVHVKEAGREIPCEKNPIMHVHLKPGEVFKRASSIFVSVLATGPVAGTETFRLGFEPRLGYNLTTQSLPYIWSNPITIRIEY
jgi:hypothetical protein